MRDKRSNGRIVYGFKLAAASLLRVPVFTKLARRMPFGSIETRVDMDLWNRPHYAYGVHRAAVQAKSLGLRGISVVEFGVAGGRGLLELERVAGEISRELQLEIQTFGFDTGEGMPETSDYRDLPHVWAKGFFKMDVPALQARLASAKLLIGDVSETVPTWTGSPDRLPIGFIAFDLDYYSSTVKAFSVFKGPSESRLPRVLCYFDDIVVPERAFYNEGTGELLAIREFNEANRSRKIFPIHLLRNIRMVPQPWNDQMYVMHDFEHPKYCVNITPKDSAGSTHLPL